jgi:hypothetical protein
MTVTFQETTGKSILWGQKMVQLSRSLNNELSYSRHYLA